VEESTEAIRWENPMAGSVVVDMVAAGSMVVADTEVINSPYALL
jgi:hypothetical protein